ncbi:MAG TPA: universal stress protein [Polyangia bacterium]|nr:universal stress protein [Polyangia bacterium]
MDTHPIKRIVVATDFSEGSDAAMERAFVIARWLGASIDLVNVLDTALLTAPASLGAVPLIEPEALMEQIDTALAARVARATEAGLVCQSNSLDGYPAKEIVRHAQKTGADLIVVGTHGRTGVAHVLMGSVAERVVQHSSCPVLVIPPARRPN